MSQRTLLKTKRLMCMLITDWASNPLRNLFQFFLLVFINCTYSQVMEKAFRRFYQKHSGGFDNLLRRILIYFTSHYRHVFHPPRGEEGKSSFLFNFLKVRRKGCASEDESFRWDKYEREAEEDVTYGGFRNYFIIYLFCFPMRECCSFKILAALDISIS